MENIFDGHILNRLDQIVSNTAPLEKSNRPKYYNTITIVDTPGFLKVEDTAQTTFYNNGTSNVNLLGLVLLPGQGIGFPGNIGEIDTTKYTYTFAGAGTNKLVIIQKLYVNVS
jgi:hypothetical protein